MAVAACCILGRGWSAEAQQNVDKKDEGSKPAKSIENADDKDLPTVTEARVRARLLFETYDATLNAMHRRYFTEKPGVPVPSRVLEEVFSRVSRRSKVSARWLAVNAQAMSIEHEPRDEFETAAVRALTSGKREHEVIDDAKYRYVGSITLFDSCLKCHAPAPMRQDGSRVAGLVISMSVRKE